MRRSLLASAFGALLLAVPTLAAASPAPVAAFGRLPAFSHPTLSPSGDRYAYIAPQGGGRKLFVKTAAGAQLLVVDVGTAKVAGLQWAGEDIILVKATTTAVVAREDRDLTEALSVAVFNIPKHAGFVVFSRYPGVIRTVFGDYGVGAINGRWFGYYGAVLLDGAGRIASPYRRLMRVDLDTQETSPVAVEGRRATRWLVAPDGALAAHTEYDRRTGDWRVGEGGFEGGKTLASGQDPFGAVGLVGFGRSEGSVVIRDVVAGREALREVGGATPGVLTDVDGAPLDGESASLIADAQTRRLVGYAAEGDAPGIRLFDPAQQARLARALSLVANPRQLLASHARGFERLIIETLGGRDSGTYWLVTPGTGEAVRIGAAYPDIPPQAVGERRYFSYAAADGFKLHGVVTTPPGASSTPRAVVVLPHGGPAAFDGLGFDWWAEALASQGYVVFQPNFRGSAGYGRAYRDAGFGEWGRKMQTDVSDGLAALAKTGLVDPSRACIVGASYGGYVAVAGVTLQKGLYRCAAAYGGVVDLPGFLEFAHGEVHSESGAVRWWRTYLGAASDHDPRLAEIDPLTHAAAADAPILLIHGQHDSVVPIRQSLDLEARLRAAGKPVELVKLESADHWLTSEAAREPMLQRTIDFVKRFNPAD